MSRVKERFTFTHLVFILHAKHLSRVGLEPSGCLWRGNSCVRTAVGSVGFRNCQLFQYLDLNCIPNTPQMAKIKEWLTLQGTAFPFHRAEQDSPNGGRHEHPRESQPDTWHVSFRFSVFPSERALGGGGAGSFAKLVAVFCNQCLTGPVPSTDREEPSPPDNPKNSSLCNPVFLPL